MASVEAQHIPALVQDRPHRPAGASDILIRLFDVVGAAALLVFVLPTVLLVALLVRLQDGGPAFFRHERMGRAGARFGCLKFRTMFVDADLRLAALLRSDADSRAEWAERRKLRRDPRVTPLGRLLRLTSIDELPQLLNVLRGDMSLVGPRPIVAEEVWRYGRRFRDYAAVKPGLTGLWQVMGRNDVPYRRRVAMDVWLARRRSLGVYFAILARTLPAVIRREGAF